MSYDAAMLLQIRDLCIGSIEGGDALVEGLSLAVDTGECIGLAGISGSGKTLTALACLGLLPKNLCVRAGQILFGGADLVACRQPQNFRGSDIAMVFQEPKMALNPVFAVGTQLRDVFLAKHRGLVQARRKAKHKALFWLERVGIDRAALRYGDPPDRFSGGERQRILIAMALINGPKIVICDEATTNLDAITQKEILTLLMDIRGEENLAMLMISHQFDLLIAMAKKIYVLANGRIQGLVAAPFDSEASVERMRTLIMPSGEEFRGQ